MTAPLKPVVRRSQLPPRRISNVAVRELLEHVREIGGDLRALVERAGAPCRAESLLDPDWTGQLSRVQFARLYAECTWALDAHASWLEKREPLTKPELDLLCYCVITCRTLREVIERTATFSHMLVPRTARLALKVNPPAAAFYMATIRKSRTVSAFVSDLTGLAMHKRLFGWLIGEELNPLEVEVCYPALLSEAVTARLMPHPILYGAPENLLRFPSSFLEKPVVRSYAELVRFLERFPFDPDEAQSKDAPFSERVRVVLAAALADEVPLPTAHKLARQLSISSATLRRRLADEGVSLLRLKDAARRDLSERLLTEGRHTIADIARRSGFSDSTTFSRAFKQWTGVPPTHWHRP